MAKFDLPKGMAGTIFANAVYAIGKETSKFTSDETREMVKWDSIDSIQITVGVKYALVHLGSAGAMGIDSKKGNGEFTFSAKWRVSFTDNGMELELDGKQPLPLSNKGEGDIAVAVGADPAHSKVTDKKPFVELVVVPVIGYKDDGVQVGFTSGVGVSAAKNIGGTEARVSSLLKYRLNLLVTDRPAAQRPIAKIPPALLDPAPVLFDEDEDQPSKSSTKELADWIKEVKNHDGGTLKTVIQLGEVPIDIQGFASTTGTAAYNKKETDQRVDAVKKILKSAPFFGSSKLIFNEKSHGKEKAEGRGAKYGYNRRVEIKIDGNKATKAIEELVRGKTLVTT